MHLYYTDVVDSDPMISFDWSREAIDQTVAEITETVHAIEDKKFDKSVQNHYACGFCDMKYVCGRENDQRGDIKNGSMYQMRQ